MAILQSTCLKCNKEFSYNSYWSQGRYCSRGCCARTQKSYKITKKCAVCKNEFTRKRCLSAQKHCSSACYGKSIKGKIKTRLFYPIASPEQILKRKKEALNRYTIKTKNGCWKWTAHTDIGGYGKLTINGKGVIASRLAYEIYNHKIPKGLFVLHKCDNPPCTNPDHLFLGTHKDNWDDSNSKGRRNVSKGSEHCHAKISEDEVREIKKKLNKGATLPSISQIYGIAVSTVCDIKKGRTWKHVKIK